MSEITAKIPFLRLLIPVIIGIVVNECIPDFYSALFFSLTGLFVMLLSFFISPNNEFQYRWFFGAGLFIFIFSLITFQYQHFTDQTSLAHLSENVSWKGVVLDIPQQKPRSIQSNIELTYPVNKKVVLYLEKNAKSVTLQPGEEIIFQAKIQPFKNFGNPDDFDYVRFMRIKGFAGSAYVPTHQWEKTGKAVKSIYTFSQHFRAKVLNFYKSFELSPDEYAFIAALTLGYKADLSDNLQDAFRASGTAHVLAVSGLHVGVIYLIINFLFSFLGNSGKKYIFRQGFIVLFLWGYVFLTGLSVSVIRAAIMLSFLCFGKAFHRQGFSYNTLAASAFFILLFNPMSFFDVGFQLSFVSVFAILFFKPKLDHFFYTPTHPFTRKVRDLSTLSLSAQLGVFPLVLHYFGTFPTYFFMTNLVIVPLISLAIFAILPVILFSGLSPCGFIVFHYLFQLGKWLLNKLIGLIIHLVYVFESLPYAQFTDGYISLLQVILIFIVLFAFSLYMQRRRVNYLYVGLGAILVFLFTNTYSIVNDTPDKVVVYNRPGVSEVFIILNKKAMPVTAENNSVVPYSSKKILKLSQNIFHSNVPNKTFPVDFLILSHDNSFSMTTLNSFFLPDTVVLDSSLSLYAVKRITGECQRLHIKVHDVSQMGSFSINL